MVFGPVLESSRPPSICIGSLHGDRGVDSRFSSWRGCLMRSIRRRRLPSRSDVVDWLASSYTGIWLMIVCWGTGPAHRVPPGFVVMVPVGRRSFPGHHYQLVALSSSGTCS
jgi:hypothetical protein